MGLYQYIREQEYRNDLVGELGRWMSRNYGKQPDHNSLAFQLASKEFEACGNWTRKGAVEQLNENKKFQHIVKIEPRISEVISKIIKTRATQGYNRDSEYYRFKEEISKLVGDGAEKDEVADSDSFDVIIKVISDLLPPDITDLYPNAEYEYEDIELDL